MVGELEVGGRLVRGRTLELALHLGLCCSCCTSHGPLPSIKLRGSPSEACMHTSHRSHLSCLHATWRCSMILTQGKA